MEILNLRDRSLYRGRGGGAGANRGWVTNFYARKKGGGYIKSCKDTVIKAINQIIIKSGQPKYQ